jgi:beta-glucosidase-like glycosyl hydrolase
LLLCDDMQMESLRRLFSLEAACREGLRAGLDLLLIGNNAKDEQAAMAPLAEALEAELRGDAALTGRHRQALARIAERKRRFAR